MPGLDGVHLPDALIVVSSFDDPAFTFDQLQPLAGKGVRTGLLLDARLDLAGLGADRFLGESHLDVRAEIGWRGTEVAGLWASIGTLTGSQQAAQAALQGDVNALAGAQAAVATFPIDQDPRILPEEPTPARRAAFATQAAGPTSCEAGPAAFAR